MRRLTMFALMTGWASLATAQAPAPRLCLNGPEAEAVFLAVAPAALRAAGTVCAPALPRGALLVQPGGALLAKLRAASDEAWPGALVAARRIAGPSAAPLLESEALRPLLATLLAPLIVADLKAADCPKVDRILTLLAPLPAKNMAALGVTILQYAQDDARTRGKRARLPLCPTP